MKKTTLVALLFSAVGMANAQTNTTSTAAPAQPKTFSIDATQIDAPMTFPDYIPVKKGLFVKIVKPSASQVLLKENQSVALHIKMFSPLDQPMNDFKYQKNIAVKKEMFGYMYDAMLYLHEGDSAMIKVNIDSLAKGQPHQGIDDGAFLGYSVRVYTAAEVAAQDAIEAAKAAEAEKQKVVRKAAEDAMIQKYFTTKKLKPMKTASGLYYVITKAGTGETPKSGETVVANYSGKLFSGVPFDSNVDTAFHHVQPFEFPVGQGRVIRGWDEGFMLLKKGTKATFYIPSELAYGENPRPGGLIKPNDPLMFDVELVDIKPAAAPQEHADHSHDAHAEAAPAPAADPSKQFEKYFADNHITAMKTPEGLYYVITKPGTGETPKAGQKVTANYTGKSLEGVPFDSNVDPKFNHVQPFEFNVGQHNVIAGWDIGFLLLNKGAKATLYIPSTLGYGAQGAGADIKPNQPLIFDVELVDFK